MNTEQQARMPWGHGDEIQWQAGDRVRVKPGTYIGAKLIGGLVGQVAFVLRRTGQVRLIDPTGKIFIPVDVPADALEPAE